MDGEDRKIAGFAAGPRPTINPAAAGNMCMNGPDGGPAVNRVR
jgi:hypothetical protein